MRIALVLAAGIAALLVDRTSAAEPERTRRQTGDLAIQSRAILGKYCGECHKDGSTRSALAVLDHKQLVGLQSPIPFAAKTGARSQILEFLDDGSMPPAGHPRPTDAEIAVLKQWIAAKAPSFPKAFDTATTQRTLLDDLEQIEEKNRPFMRYLSIAHLVAEGTGTLALKAVEFNLQRALAAATEANPAPPVPIDDSATLFRLDIRTLGWHAPDLFEKVVDGNEAGVFPMNAFDLILLEYPDAATIAGPDAARLTRALGDMKQLRPIPFLKADWFADALLNKGVHTPLAEELKSLIRLAEKKTKPRPDGKLNEDFASRPSLRSAVPPLGAFYPKHVAAQAPPFPKLTLEVIDPKGDAIALVETEEAFRLKVTADADGYFVLLMRWSNGELGVQKVEGGYKFKADKARILSPQKKEAPFAFQISGLLNGKDKGNEYFILLASPGEIAAPTIVRSAHAKFPIWRFLPEPVEPGAVQRAVAEIAVVKK